MIAPPGPSSSAIARIRMIERWLLWFKLQTRPHLYTTPPLKGIVNRKACGLPNAYRWKDFTSPPTCDLTSIREWKRVDFFGGHTERLQVIPFHTCPFRAVIPRRVLSLPEDAVARSR